ncbi:MAG: uroporphyrinogen-III synthase, partial [Ktedonobacteraceae bacterium]|nr:uroporphyrinogen-III synthase [Ktedonobacteraceae bacterium]
VLTSANGVRVCMERLRDLGHEPSTLRGARIITIGPATASALASYGLHADLVPGEYIAEGVIAALREDAARRGVTLAGQRILLARAAEARKVLTHELRSAGALVDEVAAYFTVTAAHDDEQGRTLLHMLRQQQLDILTFTSSSTVRNFMAWLKNCEQPGEPAITLVTKSPRLKIACIGPITSQTARDLGLRVDIEAREFTIEGLVRAIMHYCEEQL